MYRRKRFLLTPVVLLTVLGLLIFPWADDLAGTLTVRAEPGTGSPQPMATLTVCTAGPPACDYSTLQDAVDAAGDGDTILVAAGTYSGVEGRPVPPGYLNPPASGVITQVVYLSETLTIQGGYTTSNGFAGSPDPLANPTVVDAQGQGRALVIAGAISPTIAGLRFTGGHAGGLGGYAGSNWPPHDTGGGICVVEASAVLSDNMILGNTAGSFGSGGGLYLLNSDATLLHNTFLTNTANTLYGGGIYTLYYDGAIRGNHFSGNTARWGGGVFLEFSPATLIGNDLTGNSCAMAGGALNVHTSDAEIDGNTISFNQAGQAGGAMRLYDSAAILRGNIIAHNGAAGWGGAVHDWASSAILAGNWIQYNTAGSTGGGLEFWLSDSTLLNNVITDNQAGGSGTAMYVAWASSLQLLHNTIARNLASGAGDGSGIYVDYYQGPSSVALTNTALVSHTVGIHVVVSNTATLEGTLWGNSTDWSGDGTLLTGTVNLWGDPAFAAPDLGDYHVGFSSAARDAGVATAVAGDVDGEPRPIGAGYDLGADEVPVALDLLKWTPSDTVTTGCPLSYTLLVTNSGIVALNATIQDPLPAHVSPTGVLSWTVYLSPGEVWEETFTVTVEPGYAGPLDNRLQISTAEGAEGASTCTVTVTDSPVVGLTAGNDSPTGLGRPTTLSAAVMAGSNVTYIWDLGDGTGGSGSALAHTYPAAGSYAAVVTASNSVSLLTATTTVVVEEEIAGLAISNDGPTTLGQLTTLTATVTAGNNVTYTWSLGDGTRASGAVVTHTYPSVATYTVVVTASNSVSLLAVTTSVTVVQPCYSIFIPVIMRR